MEFEKIKPSLVKVHQKLNAFLEVLICILNYQQANPEFKNHGASIGEYHSAGMLQKIFTSGPYIKRQDINNWLMDTEHGLLHGLSVAFFALLFKHQGKFKYFADDETLIASCLVHDFIRCQKTTHDRHDENLTQLFSSLDPETYVHKHPNNESHPLIVGDRIELMRYKDHKGWVDQDVLKKYFLTPDISEMAYCFYRFIRPALEKIFQGRHDIWLRHGVEKDNILANANFQGDNPRGKVEVIEEDGIFPARYWAPYPNYWCIETGTLPFGPNITRDIGTYSPLPVLNLRKFQKWSSGEILPFRDHQCASGKVPLSEWVFLICHHNDLQRDDVFSLFENSGGVTYLALINRLLIISQMLTNMLIVLRSCSAENSIVEKSYNEELMESPKGQTIRFKVIEN